MKKFQDGNSEYQARARGYRTEGSTGKGFLILVTVYSGYRLDMTRTIVQKMLALALAGIYYSISDPTRGCGRTREKRLIKKKKEKEKNCPVQKVHPRNSARGEKDPLRPIPSQAAKFVDFG